MTMRRMGGDVAGAELYRLVDGDLFYVCLILSLRQVGGLLSLP